MSARAVIASGLVAAVIGAFVLASSALAGASTTIAVGDDFFSPSSTTISAGTKVKFNWVGDGDHDVVKKKGPGGGFSSGVTDEQGVNFTKKFRKSGTYKIICSIHKKDMKLVAERPEPAAKRRSVRSREAPKVEGNLA